MSPREWHEDAYKTDARELSGPFQHVRTQWEGLIYEPESVFSLDTKTVGTSILELPDSQTVGNTFFLFVRHPAYDILL